MTLPQKYFLIGTFVWTFALCSLVWNKRGPKKFYGSIKEELGCSDEMVKLVLSIAAFGFYLMWPALIVLLFAKDENER